MEVQEQHISVYIQSINVVNSSSNTKSKMSKKKNSQKLPSIISHSRALLDTDQNRSEARRRATHGADPLIPVTNTQQTSLTAHYRELLSCWAAGSELFGRKTSLFHINSLLCMKWWNNLVPSETTGIIMYRVQHAEPPASGTCSRQCVCAATTASTVSLCFNKAWIKSSVESFPLNGSSV